jgi:hypothetical protein
MRYFIVSYYTKPNGQIDEVVAVSKNLKTNDLQTASVILDFKKQRVEKCTAQGAIIEDKSWEKIAGYYGQHYENIFDRLARENGLSGHLTQPVPSEEG